MTLFAPTIPVLILCIFSSLFLIGVRKKITHEMNTCINLSTKIQNQHRDLTKKLLSLNPAAKHLRRSRKIAEKAYKVAIGPYKAAAKVVLEGVKASQLFLRTQQNYILTQAKIKSLKNVNEFIRFGYWPSKPPTSLQVNKLYIRSDSPEYELKKRYMEKNKIRFIKSFSLFEYTSKNILKFLKIRDSHKTLKCGSTLLKKEQKPWKVKLILDKW